MLLTSPILSRTDLRGHVTDRRTSFLSSSSSACLVGSSFNQLLTVGNANHPLEVQKKGKCYFVLNFVHDFNFADMNPTKGKDI